MESFTRTVTVDGVSYEVVFARRPFREGYEVCVEIDGERVSFGELGLGEHAALEWIRAAIKNRIASDGST